MPERKDPGRRETGIARYLLSGAMVRIVVANAIAFAIVVRYDAQLIDLLTLYILETVIAAFWHWVRCLPVLSREDLSDAVTALFGVGMLGAGALTMAEQVIGHSDSLGWKAMLLPVIALVVIHGIEQLSARSGLKDERGYLLAIASGMGAASAQHPCVAGSDRRPDPRYRDAACRACPAGAREAFRPAAYAFGGAELAARRAGMQDTPEDP